MLQNHPAPESRALPQHITDEHNGLSYTLHGDYYFPDLELPEQQPIGKWGRLHLRHLESNHPGHFQRLLLTGALNAYLHTVDEQEMCIRDRPAGHHLRVEKPADQAERG